MSDVIREVVTLDDRTGLELARVPVDHPDDAILRAASESERSGLAYMIGPEGKTVFRWGHRIFFP